MKSHCATNYSISFVANKNCFNKLVFMNQLIIVLKFLTMIMNRLIFVVLFFLNMIFLLCEWSRHCRTMYLTFCLIRLQKSSINVRCSCFVNRFLTTTCIWDKWEWMNWIYVFSFKILKDVTQKFFETIRRAIFCIFISWVVVTLTLFNRSCDAYQIELS
jgi:hypothetical protein